MIGEWVAVSCASSRWATRPKVRSRTAAMTACSSSTDGTIHRRPCRPVNVALQQAAEPGHGERPGRDEQDGGAAGEGGGDLALLGARRQPRAEPRVDLLQLVGLGRRVGLAARDAGDLL